MKSSRYRWLAGVVGVTAGVVAAGLVSVAVPASAQQHRAAGTGTLAAKVVRTAPTVPPVLRRHRERLAAAGIRIAATPAEGSFVVYNGYVFKIVGGAGLYVRNWANVGGGKPTTTITQAQYEALRPWPADGTFVRATDGRVYRFVGGAPLWVSNWANVGGVQAYSDIDYNDIDFAGRDFPWWSVNDRIIDYAAGYDETTGNLDFNGNVYIVTGQDNRAYKMVSSAPVYVTSWNNVGGGKTTIKIDKVIVDHAGEGGIYRFMRSAVDDNWAIRGYSPGTVFLTAGGAPIYLSDASLLSDDEFHITPSNVDHLTLNAAGGGFPYGFLRQYPRDGTYLLAFDDDGAYYYKVTGGVPYPVDDVPADASVAVIHQSAVTQAGTGGVWNHLLPLPPATTTTTTTTTTAGS